MPKFSITLLGRTVLDVAWEASTTGVPANRSNEQPDHETPGPVTEHRSAPTVQLGFQSRSRWADGRSRWR